MRCCNIKGNISVTEVAKGASAGAGKDSIKQIIILYLVLDVNFNF